MKGLLHRPAQLVSDSVCVAPPLQPSGTLHGIFFLALLFTSSALVACYSAAPDDETEEDVASVAQADGQDPVDLDNCTPDDGKVESISQFAQKCDDAIGASVPAFRCDDGSVVDDGNVIGTIYGQQACDRPNVLNGACDPGSKFQVLKGISPDTAGLIPSSPDALIVAHCRKKGYGDTIYGDIAVIQYNKKNGATCFYQSPVSEVTSGPGISGNVTAPKVKPTPLQFAWRDPSVVALGKCVQCHDNGPFIVSARQPPSSERRP